MKICKFSKEDIEKETERIMECILKEYKESSEKMINQSFDSYIQSIMKEEYKNTKELIVL